MEKCRAIFVASRDFEESVARPASPLRKIGNSLVELGLVPCAIVRARQTESLLTMACLLEGIEKQLEADEKLVSDWMPHIETNGQLDFVQMPTVNPVLESRAVVEAAKENKAKRTVRAWECIWRAMRHMRDPVMFVAHGDMLASAIRIFASFPTPRATACYCANLLKLLQQGKEVAFTFGVTDNQTAAIIDSIFND